MSWNDQMERAVCVMLLLFNKVCVVSRLAMWPSRWWVTGPKPPDRHSGTPWSSLWYQNKRRKQWHRTLPVPKGCDTGHLKQQAEEKLYSSCFRRAALRLFSTRHLRSGEERDWLSCFSEGQPSGLPRVPYGLDTGWALTFQLQWWGLTSNQAKNGYGGV